MTTSAKAREIGRAAEEIETLRRETESLREELAALQRAHARLASQLYAQRAVLERALVEVGEVDSRSGCEGVAAESRNLGKAA